MNEEFTLAEAMEAVDEYLSEAVKDSIEQGLAEVDTKNKINKAKKDVKKAIKKTIAGANSAKNDAVGAGRAISKEAKADIDKLNKKIKETAADAKDALKEGNEKAAEKLAAALEKLKNNKKKVVAAAAATAAVAGGTIAAKKYIGSKKVEESVEESAEELDLTALRLQVYEAFDEGTIDADEKALMLEYLNLDNYEVEE